MKISFLSQTYFPFLVPRKDSTFAANVGPQTVYPVGFSLAQALQIYWRAQNFRLIAAGNGSIRGITQALTINQLLPPRNASVGTDSYAEIDGLDPTGPGELAAGVGITQEIPGSGTITSGTDTNPAAVFDLLVYLFYPEAFAADPVVRYDGLWWPAMSVSCSVSNTITLSGGGGTREITFECDSYDPGSTIEIGTFSFFGTEVPISCGSLGSGETRTFSGSLAVETEWP
jgi:hypothetical protein